MKVQKKIGSTRIKKENLPSKICVVCMKPFSWRKKWEKNWEEVKYCSKKCSSQTKVKNMLHTNII
jgi:hypothetical protein